MKKLFIIAVILSASVITASEVTSKPTADCFDHVEKGKTIRVCCQYTGNGVVCWRD